MVRTSNSNHQTATEPASGPEDPHVDRSDHSRSA